MGIFSKENKVGPVGFEPTTFTRNDHYTVSTGFSQLQNLFIPFWSANPLFLPSGARRHTWLDYDPTPPSHFQKNACSRYSPYSLCLRNEAERLMRKRNVSLIGLPAIGRGTYPNPFRTRKSNRAPFSTLVWSSAMRS